MARSLTFAVAFIVLGCGSSSEDDDASVPTDPCLDDPQTTSGFPAALATKLDAALADNLDAANAPGVTAVVVLPGVGTWYGATGLDSIDTDEPLTTGDTFRVGSITKTFTAAAALQLDTEGAWSLDDPIDDWVSGWDFGPDVTLKRLLNHTAGVYNYTDDGTFLIESKTRTSPEDIIEFAIDHGEVAPPGTLYSYSNTGYYLVGLALENAEGKPYHEVIRQRLLEPQSLVHSHMEQYEDGYCAPVQGHVAKQTATTEGFSMSWAWAAGGLVSNVEDLCSWGHKLVLGDVLESGQRDRMLDEPVPEDSSEDYGIGVRRLQVAGRLVHGHTGSTMGFNGEMFIDRSTGVCVAVQTNDFLGVHEAISEPIWQALSDAGH